MDITAAIDDVLPQTQCTRCGYADCRAYAEALANQSAPINRCPPGGRFTIERLAELLNTAVLELDPGCGAEAPRQVAVVDEQWCIGCTLCIQACPVDAIVGAAKRMHTVIESWCNGCELCLAPCPVDCIELEPPRTGPDNPRHWLQRQAPLMRVRYQLWQQRTRRRAVKKVSESSPSPSRQQRRDLIAEAVARRRRRRDPGPVAPGAGG